MNLANLASILINIISPIVLVAAAGFLLAKKLGVEARPLSRTMLYFFTPALVFSQTYHAKLSREYASIAIFSIVITLTMIGVSGFLAKVLRYDRLTTSAFMLGVLFVNAGNYGLPLIYFAFGDEGLARAAFYFTMSAILVQTLGIFVAARGKANARTALINTLKMPLVYAVTIGLIFNLAHLEMPAPLTKAIDLAAGAAVPTMLVILGIELARAKIEDDRAVIGIATIVKLCVVPLFAFPLSALLGLDGVTRAVCIIEASMPTAVMATIVAVEFDARPKLVTGIVFASTLGSIITLTILLGILK
ncbi:MAG: AEC family transporter [Anaerolineales bacterium]|nr:AEC family transporter [Anaerolineales bacterium]